MARKITKIPQKINPLTLMPNDTVVKRKVAGYARVSTDQEEQLTSYEAQLRYYTEYIKSHDNWEFVNVYADEGISGTSTAHRAGFKQMIEDALNGKIDLIVTKSVSRFARNTVDSLTTIRKLKENNVECYFEKENIWTFDGKGELLITIMSSLAQEESRSISENVTWGHRRRMAEGKFSLAYSNFLGYKKGEDGLPEIVPEEAEIIRYIYRSFLEGMTPYIIAKELTERGIHSPGGKEKWHRSTILSILQNEKYKGSALLQKSFTTDFLTKKTKKNEGEVPQYYIEESHEAIITPEEFDLVQLELEKRKKLGKQYSGTHIFSAKLVCGECGSFFGSKVWHSTDKYRRIIWQCNKKFKGTNLCKTPHFYEDEIKEKFIKAFAVFFQGKEVICQTVNDFIRTLSDFSSIGSKISTILQEMQYIADLNELNIKNNSITAQNTAEFEKRCSELNKQYIEKKSEYDKLLAQKNSRLNKIKELKQFLNELSKSDIPLTEFNDDLWRNMIEKVTIYQDKKMTFRFLDGTDIEVK